MRNEGRGDTTSSIFKPARKILPSVRHNQIPIQRRLIAENPQRDLRSFYKDVTSCSIAILVFGAMANAHEHPLRLLVDPVPGQHGNGQ